MISSAEFKSIFEDIRLPHGFPEFIDKLRDAGVGGYVHFTATGSVNFFSRAGEVVSMRGHDDLLTVAPVANPVRLLKARERHLAGEISYLAFCQEMALSGVYKWIVDMDAMTIRYESVERQPILVAKINGTAT